MRDWARFVALPERPRQALWELLGPSLGGVDAEMERRAEAFCRLYGVAPVDLKSTLRVCRFLLTRAAACDLSGEHLAEDTVSLGPGDGQSAATLISGYGAVRGLLRRAVAEEAMFEHGKVLVGLDWRVDRMIASGQAPGLDFPVALFTMRLREGGRDERVTFYVAPEAVAQLKEACGRAERALAPEAPQGAGEREG